MSATVAGSPYTPPLPPRLPLRLVYTQNYLNVFECTQPNLILCYRKRLNFFLCSLGGLDPSGYAPAFLYSSFLNLTVNKIMKIGQLLTNLSKKIKVVQNFLRHGLVVGCPNRLAQFTELPRKARGRSILNCGWLGTLARLNGR